MEMGNERPDVQRAGEWLGAFVSAVRDVISVQAQTPATPGAVRLAQSHDSIPADVASVIRLEGEWLRGSVAIFFPASVILKVYANMLGETLPQITPEVEDAACELLNIIFGAAKAELVKKYGKKIEQAIPSLMKPLSEKACAWGGDSVWILPFQTEAGSFQLRISIDQDQA